MRTYNDMAQRVLQRRDEYLKNKNDKKAKTGVIPAIAVSSAAVIVILFGTIIGETMKKLPPPASSETEAGTELPPNTEENNTPVKIDPGYTAAETVDEDALQYFPEFIDGKYVMKGHNYAAFYDIDINEYINGLKKRGLSYYPNVGTVLYGDEAIVLIYDGDPGSYLISVITPRSSDEKITEKKAIDTINNTKIDVDSYYGIYTADDPATPFEEKYLPVDCAVDVTTDGFFSAAGFRLFACPCVSRENGTNGAPDADIIVFAVGEERAEALYSAKKYRFYEYVLASDGYYGGAVFADTDKDGVNEMFYLEHGPTSGIFTITVKVVNTGKYPVYRSSFIMGGKVSKNKLFLSDNGKVTLHSYYDKEPYAFDNYSEWDAETGAFVLTEKKYNEDVKLNEPDTEDKFVKSELIEYGTNLLRDRGTEREPITGVKAFDVNGKKMIFFSEGSDNSTVDLYEEQGRRLKATESYVFPYYDLAMLYFTNKAVSGYAYTVGSLEFRDIYQYRLDNGNVFKCIETKDRILSQTYYNKGIIYYITSDDNKYALKAAVISDKEIYKIAELESSADQYIRFCENGVYIVTEKALYYISYDGTITKTQLDIKDLRGICTGINGANLYIHFAETNTLRVYEGCEEKESFTVSDLTPVRQSDHDRFLVFYMDSLVCEKREDGKVDIYLYDLQSGIAKIIAEDITLGKEIYEKYYSFCACDDMLLITSCVKENDGEATLYIIQPHGTSIRTVYLE